MHSDSESSKREGVEEAAPGTMPRLIEGPGGGPRWVKGFDCPVRYEAEPGSLRGIMDTIDLHDRCREARNRLRADAAYYTRRAAASKRYEEKIRQQAKADAYTRAANILARAIA